MKLNSFTDYGLRVLMRLASEPERVFTTEELAMIFGISAHHLTKVVRALARGGLVVTQRGAGGGLRLARAPKEISIGEAVRLLEEPSALVECFRSDGGACVLTSHCLLKARLGHAREAFLSDLDRSTLAECAWPPRTAIRQGRATQSNAVPY